MQITGETLRSLRQIPNLHVSVDSPLAPHTRFGLGGPADVYAETSHISSFIEALAVARTSGVPYTIIGGGTNLVVSDDGFRGIVLKFTAKSIRAEGNTVVAEAGADLQDVIDFAIERGLAGTETLAGIPGSFGAAVYGNAGAYGHSMSEVVRLVTFLDDGCVRSFDNAQCEFRYRESIFKRRKLWTIFSASIELSPADAAALRSTADEILAERNAKFPPTMKCAGSIFKNLLLAELPPAVAEQVPEKVVRDGKVAAAYFLEQAGAKGLSKGDMHVAAYHANLIYNAGAGTARDLRALIAELKARVRERFGLELEEEVQYVGV
jgi:UDP-N-acetylmuramate dehydrogenase